MRYRSAALMVVVLLTIVATLAPAAMFAGGNRQAALPPFTYHSNTPFYAPAPWSPADRLTVMVELADPAAIQELDSAAVVAASARNRNAQNRLARLLPGLEAQEIFRARMAYNGIAVSIPGRSIPALLALPGVAGVHVLQPKARVDIAHKETSRAAAPAATSSVATGQGIRIGIIDSGIDYTHADFEGPGTSAAYSSNNRVLIEAGSFPTAKVVGGYDFAGDSYDALGKQGSPIPTSDPDPLDCNGLGTQVAGTAAGFGVTTSGSTYHGPYSSINPSSFRIVPGVAPEASLYALKVFGCSGATVLFTQAIDWALDPNDDGNPADRLQVLNLSVGTAFGGNDDPDAVAVNNAVQAGVVVVAGAGDNTNTFYVINSPASAQRAIAVGATDGAGSVKSTSSRGPQRGNSALKPDLVAPGSNIVAPAFSSGNGSTTFSNTPAAAPQVAGAVALLRQLYPSWTPDRIKAALLNTASPVKANGVAAPPSLAGAGQLNIAALTGLDVLAYARDNGGLSFGAPRLPAPTDIVQTLTIENTGGTLRNVTLSATAVVTEAGVTIDLPSGSLAVPAQGVLDVPIRVRVDPAALDFTLDAATSPIQEGRARHYLAEHGGYVQINAGSGTRIRPGSFADQPPVAFYLDSQLIDDSVSTDTIEQYQAVSPGTRTLRVVHAGDPSTATPIATLSVDLRQDRDYTFLLIGRQKTFSIMAIDETADTPPPAGSALLHLANANVTSDPNSGPFDVYVDGTLRTSALRAGESTAYISVPIGSHTVTFYRAGSSPTSSNLWAIEQFSAQEGERILVGSDQQGDDWNCTSKDTVCKANQRGFSAKSSPQNSQTRLLRVPFNVFPKSASNAQAASAPIIVLPGSRSFSVPIQNTGARNAGVTPLGMAGPQTPLVSAFELVASSPEVPGLTEGTRAADIQYLGVTSDYSIVSNSADTALFFGTSSYAAWSTPSDVQVQVYIDTNFDNVDDYVVANTYITQSADLPTDIFISAIYKVQPDGSLIAFDFTYLGSLQAPADANGYEVAPFNTAVMVQIVNTAALGFTSGQTSFRYHIETRSRDGDRFGALIDRVPITGALEYDLTRPAIAPINTVGNLGQRPLFLDVNGGLISGVINPLVLAQRRSQQLLVLHHHNPPGSQVQLVTLQGGGLESIGDRTPAPSRYSGVPQQPSP